MSIDALYDMTSNLLSEKESIPKEGHTHSTLEAPNNAADQRELQEVESGKYLQSPTAKEK